MFNKKNKKPLFNTIFVYFIWAVVSAFIFLFITNTYYISVLQSKTQEDYAHKLDNLSESIQVTFEEIYRTTALFPISDDLDEVLTTNTMIKNKNFSTIVSAVDALQKFKLTKAYIDSAYIIDTRDNIVISDNGTSTINEHFTIKSNYEKYPASFWATLKDQESKYLILANTSLINTTNKEQRHVVPMAQFASDDVVFSNTLVININTSYFSNLFNENKLSPNSIVFAYIRGNSLIKSRDGSSDLDLSDLELIELAEKNHNSNSYIANLYGHRYLVVTNKDPDSHYHLCAITPYSDLINESMGFLMTPLLIFSGGIILVTLLSFFLSKRIYTPIHSVALNLRENYESDNDNDTQNDLDFLNRSVTRIISDNHKLQEDLNLAIPYVCERYLLSLFEDNEILREEEVTEFLSQYDFTFPNHYFLVVQSTLNFKKDFYTAHSKAEYNAICQGSLLIANEAFSAIENRYVFSVAVNQICVILNLPEESEKSKIAASILRYHKNLDVDEEMMIVHSGVGRLYDGLNGLKKSYTESMKASSQITYMTTSMVRTYTESDEAITTSHFSMEEENQLINYLLQGNEDKVLKHLDSIITKNMDAHIGIHALKELYVRIHNTAIRVINRRHLNIYDIMGEDYINISSKVGDMATDDLYTYIRTLFTKILSDSSKTNHQNDIQNLKEYLDQHYTDDIYLDSIAEYFGKSSKYMSKYIKNSLGISFQDYISSMRIEKAKELLMTTKKSINSISLEVGFNSRHPFIRKFKILEGVTPTEFRKLRKN